MDKSIELSILIVNWNGEKYIGNCLKSLIDTIHSSTYEIILVDNKSSDNSCQFIRENYPEVKLIENSENSLFAKANNMAYSLSSGNIIALINPDIVVKPGVVDELIIECRENIGYALTTVLYNEDDTIQYRMHRGFPSFLKLFFSMLCVFRGIFCNLKMVRDYFLVDLDFSKDQFIDQAAGALLFLNRKHIDLIGGLFDEERFPLFYNDVDLCFRLWKHDIPVLCKSTKGVYHLKSVSLRSLKFNENIYQKLFGAKNYFKKHKLYVDYFLVLFLYLIYNILCKIYSNKHRLKNEK